MYKRKKEQQKQDQLDREQSADVSYPSDHYRQPAAFDRNPYWSQEIALGPGPPPRHLSKKQKRWLARLRTDDTYSRSSAPAEPVHEGNLDGGRLVLPMSERWKLHQREDEPLWGSQQHLASLSPSGTSAENMQLDTALSKGSPDRNPSSSYKMIARNPPINDMSPPVVVNPAQSPVSNMWMLQPPPPAEVMSGHAPTHTQCSRSRSTTISSTNSWRTADVPLSRQLSQRLVQEKLNKRRMLYPRHRIELSDSTSSSEDEAGLLGIQSRCRSNDKNLDMQQLRRPGDGSDGSGETSVHSHSVRSLRPSTALSSAESLRQSTMVSDTDHSLATQRHDFARSKPPTFVADTQVDTALSAHTPRDQGPFPLTETPKLLGEPSPNQSTYPHELSPISRHDRSSPRDRPTLTRRRTVE